MAQKRRSPRLLSPGVFWLFTTSIEAIVLPIEPCADHLIWTGAMSGILSAKEAYL